MLKSEGKKILKHLDLWDVKRKPPPRANGPPTETIIMYDQSPAPSADDPPSLMMLRRDTFAFANVASVLETRFRSISFGAASYTIEADRSTLSYDPEAPEGRLSTGYPN